MMVYFLKRLPKAIVNECNERIVRHGLHVIRSSVFQDQGDDRFSGTGTNSAGNLKLPHSRAPANPGSLLIDATCAPLDIRHPTDLSLLNEAREETEVLIDPMHPQIRETFGHNPRTHRQKRGSSFWLLLRTRGTVSKAYYKSATVSLDCLLRQRCRAREPRFNLTVPPC